MSIRLYSINYTGLILILQEQPLSRRKYVQIGSQTNMKYARYLFKLIINHYKHWLLKYAIHEVLRAIM